MICNFSPNQTLPPGYTVEDGINEELWRWVLRDENGEVIDEGSQSWDRFWCRRCAWAHYNANNPGQALEEKK